MAFYRIYCLDGVHRFLGAETIEAENDERAMQLAAQIPRCVWREVWQGARLVGRIECDIDGPREADPTG